MSNETVLDALKAMGKSTARDIAARLKIEPIEALELLREQEELSTVSFLNGFWLLAPESTGDQKVATEALVPTPTPTPGAVKPVEPADIVQLLRKNGAMTTKAIASEMGCDARGAGASMGGLARKGVVVKIGKDKGGCMWRLSSAEEGPAETKPSVEEERVPVTKPAAAESLPVPDSTTINTGEAGEAEETGPGKFIFGLLIRGNRERRRLREDTAKLDEVCGALRVLHKHQHLVKTLSED